MTPKVYAISPDYSASASSLDVSDSVVALLY